jgi:hypothetical protein
MQDERSIKILKYGILKPVRSRPKTGDKPQTPIRPMQNGNANATCKSANLELMMRWRFGVRISRFQNWCLLKEKLCRVGKDHIWRQKNCHVTVHC